MIDRVSVLWVSAAALLAAVLVLELHAGDAETLPVVAPAPAPAPEAAARVRSPRADELVETALSRPLFAPTRRPPTQAKVGHAAGPELPDMRLTGVIIEGERRLAVFAVPGAKPLVRSEGDALNEWRLDSISLHEVELSGPGRVITLEPKSDPGLVRPPRAARSAGNPAQPGAINGRPAANTPTAAAQPKPPPGAGAPARAANAPRSRQ